MSPPDSIRSVNRGRPRLPSLLAATAVLAALAIAPQAHAGAQREEHLSNAVRTALAAAVAEDRSPPEPRFQSVVHKVDWLSRMADRLPRRQQPDLQTRVEFLKTVHYEATRAGLDPQLVLGLIEVESAFRKYAVSSVGARGYMQVMPFWSRTIGDGDAAKLFDMRANLRFGCNILRHYIDIERGDLYRALGRYNGSLGRPEYPTAVMRAAAKWAWTPPAPLVAQPSMPGPSPAAPSASTASPLQTRLSPRAGAPAPTS